MRMISRLMPPEAGKRWLDEADSILFEISLDQQKEITRNYIVTSPRVIATAWINDLSRLALAISGRTTSRRSDAEHTRPDARR
jgi:hypothetical protein